MKTLSKVKLSDMVSEALVEFILEQSLTPGDRMPTEKAISEMLGIGRTSVREGIRELEAVGLLTSKQGNGVFLQEVTIDTFFKMEKRVRLSDFLTLSNDQVLDLLEARIIIESSACRLTAQRVSDEELDQLKELCQKMEECLNRPEEFLQYDLEFHRLIIKASGNLILQKIVTLIRDLYSNQFILSAYPEAIKNAHFHHRNILEALEKRDVNLAVQRLTDHLEEVQTIFHEKCR